MILVGGQITIQKFDYVRVGGRGFDDDIDVMRLAIK